MININWNEFIHKLTIFCAFAFAAGFVICSFLWIK